MSNDNSIQTIGNFNNEVELVKYLINSGAIPESIQNPGQALSIVKLGRELGMEPMTALTHISLVKGKAYQSTDYLISNFVKRGGQYRIMKMTDTENEIKIMDKWGTWLDFSFSIEDAKIQGLWHERKDKYGNFYSKYKTMPKRMLFIRNIRQAILTVDPGAMMGNGEVIIEQDPGSQELMKTASKAQSEYTAEVDPQVTDEVDKSREIMDAVTKDIVYRKASKREEILKKLNDYRVEMGLTLNSAVEPLLSSVNLTDIKEVPEDVLEEFVNDLAKELEEHKRLQSLGNGEMDEIVRPQIESAKTDEDLNAIIAKYSRYKTFDITLKSAVTQKRNLINSKK